MNIHKRFSNSIAQIYIICVYIPIYIQLGRLCLQYKKRPTILRKVNPKFPYGGLICPKSLIVEKFLEKEENKNYFTKTLALPAENTLQEKIRKVENFIQEYHLHYPIILKPDDGIGGVGLKFIHEKDELNSAISKLKKNYVLQEYISRSNEFSIFFIKQPGELSGRIRSMTRRYSIKKAQDPELMIPERKIICKDESQLVTPAINHIFNTISDIPWFYFGRFDIRVKDVEKFLSEGKDFTILEVNVGAHSIALHAFDKKYGRFKRYRIFFDQLRFAFEIANQNAETLADHPHQNFTEFLKKFIGIFQ